MKKTALALTLLSLPLFLAAAEEPLISGELYEQLVRGETLSRAHFDASALSLTPKDPYLEKTIAEMTEALAPSLMVESLCLYRKPKNARPFLSPGEKTRLFNGIVSLSTLAGLRYYSASRKEPRLLYEKSVVLDSPETKKPLDDPVFTTQTLPAQCTLYARQKDLTFGDNIYRFDFTIQERSVFFTQTNLTSMYYGIIPVLGKNKLRSIVAILDTEGALLIYMLSMADAISFPGMKNRVGASFASRSEAVLGWFARKADAIYEIK